MLLFTKVITQKGKFVNFIFQLWTGKWTVIYFNIYSFLCDYSPWTETDWKGGILWTIK